MEGVPREGTDDLDSLALLVLPQMLCFVVYNVTAIGVGHLVVRGVVPLSRMKS
jgi:hypothetical protein